MLEDSPRIEGKSKEPHQNVSSVHLWVVGRYCIVQQCNYIDEKPYYFGCRKPTNDKEERPRVRGYTGWWASTSSFSQTLDSRDHLGRSGWGMVSGPSRTYCWPAEHRVGSCILA